jgi:ribosomal protein S12 methylthiotransferase accessory factor
MAVGAWDITTDIAIPAFKCIIAERDHDAPRLMYGSQGLGCHPKRGIALLRAITEAVQVRLTFISGARDNVSPRERALAMDSELMRRQDAVLAGQGSRDFGRVQSVDGPSFDADVTTELGALASAGIEQAIVVDLTSEDFGIPVVRVLVPGLEGPLDLVPPCRIGRRVVSLAASRE